MNEWRSGIVGLKLRLGVELRMWGAVDEGHEAVEGCRETADVDRVVEDEGKRAEGG